MKKQITAIIPTLSNTTGLKKTVSWLKANKYSVVIIDNKPTPQKQKFCKKMKALYFPQLKNTGFAAAINLGFKQVKTPWTLILNDDIEFTEERTLEKMIGVASENNWEAISPVLQKPSGEIENLGYTVLPKGKIKLNNNPNKKNLDGITAACLLIKTDIFKKIEGFDERFFAYLEDVDLFLRLKKAGHGFGIANKVRVVHNHMTTSSKMGNFKAKMDLRNWCFLIIKNWDKTQLFNNLESIFWERLKNLSGYCRVTHQIYQWKSIFIIPKDLALIMFDLIRFCFRP